MRRPTMEEIGSRQSVLGPQVVGFMRGAANAVTAGALLSGAAVGAAMAEARFPLTRRYDVRIAPRPGLKEFTILHIADLHMFPGQEFIRDYIAAVAKKVKFDFVVSTGDNLGAAEGLPLLLEALEPLLETPGAFVLGSNDYYSPEFKSWASYLFPRTSLERAERKQGAIPDLPWLETVQAMSKAGWLDLTNQSADTSLALSSGTQPLSLIGVDDPHIKRDRMPNPSPGWSHPLTVRLGVSHAPYRRVLDSLALQGTDVILSGHTHGGQIRLPKMGAIVTNTDISRKYSRGLYDWVSTPGDTSTKLHVSAGLGTSPFAPVRLFCRPEVSLLRVCPA